jgi:hypothetical protein
MAAMGWTTAAQNGRNPMTYLTEYLTACAQNGNQPMFEEVLAAYLPLAGEAVDTG